MKTPRDRYYRHAQSVALDMVKEIDGEGKYVTDAAYELQGDKLRDALAEAYLRGYETALEDAKPKAQAPVVAPIGIHSATTRRHMRTKPLSASRRTKPLS